MIKIIISRDFSKTPGGRKISEGKFSGEEFREKILAPKFEDSLKQNIKIFVDFDGCYGFADIFLEEAFGGLVRKYEHKDMFDKFVFKSKDDKTIKETVKKYMFGAEKVLKNRKGI